MDLPKAVRTQADYVSAMEAQIAREGAAEPQVPDASEQPAEPAPEQAAPSSAASEPHQDAASHPPAQPPVDWEQKYRTLQGMFNSQVGSFNERIKTLTEQLQGLQEAQATRPPTPAAAEAEALKFDPAALAKASETFGADLVETIQSLARDESLKTAAQLKGLVAELRAELAQIKQGFGTVSQSQEEIRVATFLRELAALVPDFAEINVDQAFMDWLTQIDQLSGQNLQALFNTAVSARDPQRAAVFFNRFKAETGRVAPQPQPAAPRAPQPSAALARQVQPGRSQSASQAPTTASQPSPISEQEIARFYEDLKLGRYVGRENDAIAREAEINAAVSRGLVMR